MVAKIRSDGTSSRSTAGEIHSALPKLRDQLQSRGRHGATLHRETKRRRSRETLERIRQSAVLAAITQRIAVISKAATEFQNMNWNLNEENRKTGKQEKKTSCVPAFLIQISWFLGFQIPSSLSASS